MEAVRLFAFALPCLEILMDGDTTYGNCYLFYLDSGYSMDIERMTKMGQVINEITLTPAVIDRCTVDPEPPGDLDDPVQVLDTDNLIMLIRESWLSSFSR